MRRLLLPLVLLLVFSPLIAGALLLGNTVLFVASAESAIGEVTGTSQAAEKMWHAHFSYVDAAGQTRFAMTAGASTFNTYDIGTKLPILYRPDAPDIVRIATFWKLWGLPVLILGPSLLVYFLLFAALRRRWKATASG